MDFMVKHIEGNIIDSRADIIFHQVNCQGVMGSGLAKQLREWCPVHYEDYKYFCDTAPAPEALLGEYIFTPYDIENKLYICGIFGQFNYGHDGKCYTSYNAVRRALINVKVMANRNEDRSYRFAVPYKMCCGLAGGNWDIILEILSELFGDTSGDMYDIALEIWRLPR
jgi:O-acetyl-ADP-ribose deacetylase (regulator of RNase III)